MTKEQSEGYIILMDRLLELMIDDEAKWNGTPITNDMIKSAIVSGMPEETDQFGCGRAEINRSDDWHIGRIIYFINHPEEIRDIWIDNECYPGRYPGISRILPIPIIDDGNHRYRAAKYLGFKKIHCQYGGRTDVLAYLTGESDEAPLWE